MEIFKTKMKKLLFIIPVLIAVLISPLFAGGDSVIAADVKLTEEQIKAAALDEYDGNELTKVSDTQYKIDYPGTGSSIEIGSKLSFNTDLKISHWNDEVSFSLIAPVDINSKSQLTADMFSDFITDKVVASNGEWNFEYYAVWPNEFNESGGIDIIITAKEKPASNKIYFTYNSETVTPYYQGALTPEEIEEGASRPEHVIGSIAFYANEKANHAIGDINYKTGKVGHLYAMRAGNEWCRWGIEGDYIVLTIPDKVYNGVYPVVISPVGDTFGYTTAGGSYGSTSDARLCLFSCPAAGTATLLTSYTAYGGGGTAEMGGAIYDASKNKVAEDSGNTNVDVTPGWDSVSISASLSIANYYLGWWIGDGGDYYYDTGAANQMLRDSTDVWETWKDPFTDNYQYARKMSIYCTYTPSGGGGISIPVVMHHYMHNIKSGE